MPTWVIAISGVALLIVAFLLVRGRKKAPEKAEPAQQSIRSLTPREQLERIHQSDKFWGVAIETREDSHACKAVRKITDQSFQTFKAPKLPLKDCDNINCRCRYYGLPDLRKSERRETTTDRRETIRYEPNKDNRRSGEDRRKEDELWNKSNMLGL